MSHALSTKRTSPNAIPHCALCILLNVMNHSYQCTRHCNSLQILHSSLQQLQGTWLFCANTSHSMSGWPNAVLAAAGMYS